MNDLIQNVMHQNGISWSKDCIYVGNRPILSEEAIIRARLNWEVKKTELYHVPMGESFFNIVPKHKAIVRQSDYKVLGIVGNQYHPIQNKEAFKFMDTLVEEGLMEYHTVGSLQDGKRVWILGKIGNFEVVNGDQIDEFIFLWNSHDGSSSLRCLPTAIRIVCANAVQTIFKRGRGTGVRIKHTAGAVLNLEAAKEVLIESSKSLKEFKEFTKLASNLQMNTSKINQFVENIFPMPSEDVSTIYVDKVREKFNQLMEEGLGTDIPGVQGTGWGVFNAVTEYTNHYKRSRGNNQQERRFESVLLGESANIINRAVKEITKMAI